MKRLVIFFGLILASISASAETTVFQSIGPINYNGNDNISFFRGDQKWGAAGCPNATYVQVKSDVLGRNEILSIALSAKMAAKRVQFWGACDTDTNYFNAFYIIVE